MREYRPYYRYWNRRHNIMVRTISLSTFDDDAVLDPRPRSDNTRGRDRIRICRKGSTRETLDRG